MNTKDIQRALASHGFPLGAVDGVAGPATKAAVQRFQRAYCGPDGWLDVDGIAGPRTQEALEWVVQTNSLVTHFSIGEVSCHHCGCAYVDRRLLSALFDTREKIGRPLSIADAFRCAAHNAAINGAKDSQHPYGLAADPRGLTIAEALSVGVWTGIGSPDKRLAVHVDLRAGDPARPVLFQDTPK
jgi:zinc D-Ala-D-Ala carboxypeptidase